MYGENGKKKLMRKKNEFSILLATPRNTLLDMYASTRHGARRTLRKQFFLVINEDDDDAQDDNLEETHLWNAKTRREVGSREEANSFGGWRVRAGDRRGRRRW